MASAADIAETVFREEYGRLVATLIRLFNDFIKARLYSTKFVAKSATVCNIPYPNLTLKRL